MALILHIANGAFELSETYMAADVIAILDDIHGSRLQFDLADGGVVEMHVATSSEWALVST